MVPFTRGSVSAEFVARDATMQALKGLWGFGGGSGAAPAPAPAPAPTAEAMRPLGCEREMDPRKALNVDISEVAPRVYVCNRLWKSATRMEARRNNELELAMYCKDQFGQKNCMVFFVGDEEDTTLNEALFDNQVVHLHYISCFSRDMVRDRLAHDGLPMLEELFQMCYMLQFWLAWSPEHVAIIPDTPNLLRVAFFVSAYKSWKSRCTLAMPDTFGEYCLLRKLPDDTSSLESKYRSWRKVMLDFQACLQAPLPHMARRMFLSRLIAWLPGPVASAERLPQVHIFQGGEEVWPSFDAGADAGAELIFADGHLRCDIRRWVEGDIRIFILVDTVRRGVNAGAGGAPSAVSKYIPSEEVEDSPSQSQLESHVLMRCAFHTNALPDDSDQVVSFKAMHVDLSNQGLVNARDFELNLMFSAPADAGAGRGGAGATKAEVMLATGAGTTGRVGSVPALTPTSPMPLHPLASPKQLALDTGAAKSLPHASLEDAEGRAISTPANWFYSDQITINDQYVDALNLQGSLASIAGGIVMQECHAILPLNNEIEHLVRCTCLRTLPPALPLQCCARVAHTTCHAPTVRSCSVRSSGATKNSRSSRCSCHGVTYSRPRRCSSRSTSQGS
ncbi:hypothetical protein EON62_01830 [archaeon]|nr:MAG: hypothetical protein EON62_01830 [archaeon]